MTQTNDPTKLGAEECICGRWADKSHCPYCGSYGGYATVRKKSKRVDSTTGQLVEFKVWRCRRCGEHYDDWQWRNECKAPVSVSEFQRRIRERENKQIAKHLSDTSSVQPMSLAEPSETDLERVMNKLRAERGLPPIVKPKTPEVKQ